MMTADSGKARNINEVRPVAADMCRDNHGRISPGLLLFLALLLINAWLFNYIPGLEVREVPEDIILQHKINSEPQIPVMLYFTDGEGTKPAFEDRRVPKRDSLVLQIREVINALAEGPRSRHLHRVLPPGTEFRTAYLLEDGLVYVDFTAELREGHISGTTAERLTVQCIVKTLCELPEVSRVKILIQGQEVDTLHGHVSLVEPLDSSGQPGNQR